MLEQLALDLGHGLRRAARRRAARRAPRRARRSSGGSRTGRRRARRAAGAAARAARRARRRARPAARAARPRPSSQTRRTQVRWLSPTWSTTTRVRLDAEQRANCRWKPIATLQRPIGAVARVEQRARDDPDRIREVDDPGAVRGALAHALGDLEHDRHGAQRLREARRRRSSPGRCSRSASGTVSSASRAAWPPTRIWMSTKSAPSTARSRSPVTLELARVTPAARASAARGRRRPRGRSASMSCSDELVDVERATARRRARACTSSPPPTTAIFIPSPRSA